MNQMSPEALQEIIKNVVLEMSKVASVPAPEKKVEAEKPKENDSSPMHKTATYELKYPVETKGRTITSITLRRPKYGDLELAMSQSKGNTSDIGRNMICNLGMLTHDEFRELDFIDYTRLSKFAKNFFVGGETETILQEIGLE